MAGVSNQMIYDRLENYIEKNEESHDKITKMLLGNGDVGLLEQARDHDRLFIEHKEEITKHCEKIDYIEKHYSRRNNESKWAALSIPKKVAAITAILAFIKSNDLLDLAQIIIKWVSV